jgi:hypothetical protein
VDESFRHQVRPRGTKSYHTLPTNAVDPSSRDQLNAMTNDEAHFRQRHEPSLSKSEKVEKKKKIPELVKGVRRMKVGVVTGVVENVE